MECTESLASVYLVFYGRELDVVMGFVLCQYKPFKIVYIKYMPQASFFSRQCSHFKV